MADIKQRIVLEGGDEVKRQFADMGDAGKAAFTGIKDSADRAGNVAGAIDLSGIRAQIVSLVDGARTLLVAFDQVVAGASRASAQVQTFGAANAAAARQVSSSASNLASVAKTATITAGAIAAIGIAVFNAAKQAATGAKAIGDAASDSGTSLESFQKAKFILEQMGLSSKDAEKAVSDLTDKVKENMATAVDALDKAGVRFANTEAGANALRTAIGQLGTANVALAPLIDKLRQIGVLVSPNTDPRAIANLAQSLGVAGGALGKIKNEDPDAVKVIRDVAEAIKALGNEALQKQAALNAFPDFGKELVDSLKDGGAGIDAFLADFKNLNLGVKQDAVDLSTAYTAAMSRFNTASQTARIEFGARFLPAVTEGIKQFTNLLRLNRQPLQEWASDIVSTLRQVAADVFALFNGGTIKTEWLSTLRELVTQIVVPAFKGLGEVVSSVVGKINALFGTNFSTGGAGIAAVIAFLVGGFNTLLLLVGALFLGSSPLIDKFKAQLSGLGIDVDGIKTKFLQILDVVVKGLGQVDWKGLLGDIDAKDVAVTITGLIAAFLLLRRGLALIAPLVSKAIGKEVGGDALFFWGILGQITGVTNAFVTLLVGAAAATTLLINGWRIFAGIVGFLAVPLAALLGIPASIVAAVIVAIAAFIATFIHYGPQIEKFFIDLWDGVTTRTAQAWETIKSTVLVAWQFIADALSSGWQATASAIQSIIDGIVSAVNAVIDLAQRAYDAVRSLNPFAGGSAPESSGVDPSAFAGGGSVSGPGTATSDSILARLSDGEFVQPARRVMQYGRDFMEALRFGLISPRSVRALMGSFRGFNAGGLVNSLALNFSPMVPGFADGGMATAPAAAASPLAPAHFHFPDGSTAVGLFAHDDLATLKRRAVQDGFASAGPAPSWVRS